MEGWIKIHRKFLDWEWYTDGHTMRVFIHLLLTASTKDKKWRGHTVPKGSVVIGRKKLAEKLKIGEQSVRTALKHLELTNEVTIKKTTQFSMITMVNWEEYQGANHPANQQLTIDQPTGNQRLTTSKESKESKEEDNRGEIEDQLFDEFWKIYPKKRAGSKERALKAFKKACGKDNPENIIAGAEMYAVSDEATREEGKYAKGAAAWLNDDRWMNQYQPGEQQKPQQRKML